MPAIPHRVRAIAREAYRHAMYTGWGVQDHNGWYTDVWAVEGHVVVRPPLNFGSDTVWYHVPVAKSWL